MSASSSKAPLYVVSWGWNDSGRCGNLTASEIRIPQQIQKQIRSITFVDCCAGKHHSLLLSDEGLVYGIGDGRKGQLGIGNQFTSSNNNNEKPNSSLQAIAREATPTGDYKNRCDIRASQIAAGGSFSLSKELSMEEGMDLVTGFRSLEASLRRLRDIYGESRAIQVAWAHVRHEKFMIGAKSAGQVLVWGTGLRGELGLGPFVTSSPFPQPVPTFTHHNISIRSIAAGMRHVLAVDVNGRLYSWGYGRDGRLGHGDFVDRHVPSIVRFFNSLRVESCAAGDAHSVVITTTRTGSRDGQLRRISAFGRGAHGRLGNGSNRNASSPVLVSQWLPSLKTAQFHSVACGGAHTVVLASILVPACLAFPFGLRTVVVTWGYGSNGQLGTGLTVDSFVPAKAKMPKSAVIVEVSAGRSWSMARSVAGELFVWGKGLRGQLGIGNDKFSFGPRKVECFASFVKISSNLAHNVGIAVPRKALTLSSAELLARTTHQGYNAFKQIVPLQLRSTYSQSFFAFDCCRRSGPSALAKGRKNLRFHCLDCRINCICNHCARLCHRNHRLLDMDKTLYFDASALKTAGHTASQRQLPYTSTIEKLDEYLQHLSIDKATIASTLSYRCAALYSSNMHLLRPKRGRLEMRPSASLLLVDPFSMALFTDREYAEYEQLQQKEALRKSKLKRKVFVIRRKRHAASTNYEGVDDTIIPGLMAKDKSRVVNDENKVARNSKTNALAIPPKDVLPSNRKAQPLPHVIGDTGSTANRARGTEFKTFPATVAAKEQVVAPACHCGLFNRSCRVLPMIPEDCDECCLEDTLGVRLERNPDYLSLAVGRRGKGKAAAAIVEDVRERRINQFYLRRRTGTLHIAARRIQRFARSFMKKIRDRRAMLKSIILRREVCARHVTEAIIGGVFKKFDDVYEAYRQEKERAYMQYEDMLMRSYEQYKRLQRALVSIEAMMFGTGRLVGSMSPKLPRVSADGHLTTAWRPTYAFSWTSIRSQQLNLHPTRRVPVSLLAHVTRHVPRASPHSLKEGGYVDADLGQFTRRFLRSIPYERWRRKVAQAVLARAERRRLIAQLALEKLKARQNYKRDLLAQAEAISLANQHRVNAAAKPPPGPPPRSVLVHAAEQLKQEQRLQQERAIAHQHVVEDRDFSVQKQYAKAHHPRRRHTILDPVQLYARLTGMRSLLVKNNAAKRRNSLPAQLSSLYVDYHQPTPRLRLEQISESLVMFEDRLGSLTSLCIDISGIKSSADPAKALNRCYNKMLKTMACPVLNPRIPLEMHHSLLNPRRRRTIAEPERIARQLSVMIDTREKFAEAIDLSRRSLDIDRRRRSFDVGEHRDEWQGIERILGINYIEQRVAATTTSLTKDSETMMERMIRAKMVEGDELQSVGSSSVMSMPDKSVVTAQDEQIRALQQQRQLGSPVTEPSGAMNKKKRISSMAAVRALPSQTVSIKSQDPQMVDATMMAEPYQSNDDFAPHYEITPYDEGSSSIQFDAEVDPQLYHTWQEHYDDEGRAYYYNAFTGESSWEMPSDPATQVETQNQDETGSWYWFNSVTGAVKWM